VNLVEKDGATIVTTSHLSLLPTFNHQVNALLIQFLFSYSSGHLLAQLLSDPANLTIIIVTSTALMQPANRC
jgi:hypothetical protein